MLVLLELLLVVKVVLVVAVRIHALIGLTLAWYTEEPLCCIHACIYIHLHMQHSKAA